MEEDGQPVVTGGIQHVSEGMIVQTGDGPGPRAGMKISMINCESFVTGWLPRISKPGTCRTGAKTLVLRSLMFGASNDRTPARAPALCRPIRIGKP